MVESLGMDRLHRPLRDLRVSVTDRCNFRCSYCMPHDEYDWVAKEGILSFEEISRLVKLFVALGIEKLRLTGGEPLVRRDLPDLVRRLTAIEGLREVSLTTNGALLAKHAVALREAGLSRLNVSLDSLRPNRFRQLTKRGELSTVLEGIEAARAAGFAPIKLNAVIVRGVNEDEIVDLYRFAREQGHHLRYIEYMDVGGDHGWSLSRTVSKREILELLASQTELTEVGRADDRAPAVDFKDGEKGLVGVIGSVSEPFCDRCTRGRLTAEGQLVTCLFAGRGFDLRAMLRDGSSDEEIAAAIGRVWGARVDRYSEERAEALLQGKEGGPDDRQRMNMIRLGG